MVEYIEREAALASLCKDCSKMVPSDERELCRYRFTGCMEYYNVFELPAADVAPVVRCKDCKYGVLTKNGFLDDMIACENKDSPCGYSSWLCQLDWFCADGERREVQDG